MGFKCGIVGLPNVGKSTLFNALTRSGVPSENYPFCTIDPHVGRVAVPDERLQVLSSIVHPERVVPTTMEFVDIAGLVKGASQGEGLGNQFLANIRETEVIVHVLRCFTDDDIMHVLDRVDPLDDFEIIQTELMLADLDTLERAKARVSRKAQTGDAAARLECGCYERIEQALGAGQRLERHDFSETEWDLVRHLHLLTLKPILIAANVVEQGYEQDPLWLRVSEFCSKHNIPLVPICARLEMELSELSDADREAFLGEMGLEEPGLNRLVRAGYARLGLQTFFTAGEKEVRAWTIPRGATALEAASCIHTDIARGFIRAEVIAYDDYVGLGGEAKAKEAGKWRLEGKEYVLSDGDVVYFRFNV